MGLDRFVNWRSDERPTFDEVVQVTRDFFGEAAKVSSKKPWVVALLHGTCSEPLKNTGRVTEAYAHRFDDGYERTIEVYVGKDHLSVITRMTDAYTGALADGLAKVFARGWPSKRET